MRRIVGAFLLLSWITPPPAHPQGNAQISPGDSVRVTSSECSLRNQGAKFLGVTGDSIFLSADGNDIPCPVTSLRCLELYQGRFNWGMGGTLGLGLGGLVGADLAAGGELNPSKTESYIGFLVGGAIGAAVGNGFGARKYVLIGAGVGTLVGAAGWGGKDDMSVILVPAGFVAGAAVGSLIGFIRGMNRWKEVRLPLTPAEFYRTPDGRFGMSLSIPLRK